METTGRSVSVQESGWRVLEWIKNETGGRPEEWSRHLLLVGWLAVSRRGGVVRVQSDGSQHQLEALLVFEPV